MPVEIKDGKVRVWTSYGLKLSKNYNSEDSSIGIEIEMPVPDQELPALLVELEAMEQSIINHLKFGVAAELGIEMDTGPDGVARPQIPTDKPARKMESRRRSGGGSSRQTSRRTRGRSRDDDGGGRSPVDWDQVPTFEADLDGTGVCEWYDQRVLKGPRAEEAYGKQYAENAADFRDTEDPKHQVWLYTKSGNIKTDVADELERAGVDV